MSGDLLVCELSGWLGWVVSVVVVFGVGGWDVAAVLI